MKMIINESMNSTCIFVMDAICYAHIPAEFSRSGALGPGRVGSLLISQINVGHIGVICMFGLY